VGSGLLTQVAPSFEVVMMLRSSPEVGSPTTASCVPSMMQLLAVGQVTSEGSDWPSGNERGSHCDPDALVVNATPRFSSVDVPTTMHEVARGQDTLFSRVTPIGRVDTVLQVCPPSTVLIATPAVLLPTRLYPTARQELCVAQAMASRCVTPESGAVLAQREPPSVLTAAISCPGVPKPWAPTARQTSADGQAMASSPAERALPLRLPDIASELVLVVDVDAGWLALDVVT
jgi:hypothetical protein